MKTKIFLLACLAILFGTKTFAQNPCSPHVGITFTNVSSAGATLCIQNMCTGALCCYNIPTCGSGGEIICLDGSGSGSGCVALDPSNFVGTDANGNPCWTISVYTYNHVIYNSYYASYNTGTSHWTLTLISSDPQQSHYTFMGVAYPDLTLTSNTDGSLSFNLGYPDAIDDNGATMHL
jgi:hypothetical protein